MDAETARELLKIQSHVVELVESVRILQQLAKAHDSALQVLTTLLKGKADVHLAP